MLYLFRAFILVGFLSPSGASASPCILNALSALARGAQQSGRAAWRKLDETSGQFRQRLLTYDPVSDTDRLSMIRFVNGRQARGSRVLDVENSYLKKLNDELGDQDLATALTNQHKEILSARMDEFARQHSDILEVIQYSDFKSQRFALVPKNRSVGATGIPNSVLRELDEVFTGVNRDFAAKVRSMGIETDLPPELWFRAGLARNADEANLNARFAREQGNSNTLMHEDNPAIDLLRRQSFSRMERARYQVTRDLPSNSPLTVVEDGVAVPSADVFNLIKKSGGDASRLRRSIESTYPKVTVSDDMARRLIRYGDEVDQFQPGIWQSSRNSVSVGRADNGAVKIDVGGMGSRNAYQTARQSAHCSVAGQISQCARFGEGIVTREFLNDLDSIREISLANCRRRGLNCDIQISGDDVVIIPRNGRLPDDFAQSNIEQITSRIGADRIRQVQILDHVRSPVARQQLINDGEAFEKALRARLRESPLNQRASQMTFSIEMRGTQSGQGGIHIRHTGLNTDGMSAESVRNLEAQFTRTYREALEELNKKAKGSYSLSPN